MQKSWLRFWLLTFHVTSILSFKIFFLCEMISKVVTKLLLSYLSRKQYNGTVYSNCWTKKVCIVRLVSIDMWHCFYQDHRMFPWECWFPSNISTYVVVVCVFRNCCLLKQVSQVSRILFHFHFLFWNTYSLAHCKRLKIIRGFSKNEKELGFTERRYDPLKRYDPLWPTMTLLRPTMSH